MLTRLKLVNQDSLGLITEWLSDDSFRWLCRMQHEPLNSRQLLEYLDPTYTFTFIAYDGTEPMGYARLTHYQEVAGLGVALLPYYQGYGKGVELTNRLNIMAYAMGKRQTTAVTLEDNKRARRVLEKCKFLEKGERFLNPDLKVIDYIHWLQE